MEMNGASGHVSLCLGEISGLETEISGIVSREEETYGHGEREGEGEMYGRSNMETYITVCKIANGNLVYGSGNSNRGSISI